ncbi:hypothetical protein [Salinicoccus kekensis]|uniref:hypothetical protein n=1 Tax=Salinicoccus kekensis TaxID=714307 RepID=UPI0015C8648B|nr:hypothetical protein [Salinicoccus kekensis]
MILQISDFGVQKPDNCHFLEGICDICGFCGAEIELLRYDNNLRAVYDGGKEGVSFEGEDEAAPAA